MPTPASERIPNELLIYERERRGWTRVNLAVRLELPSGDRGVRRWEEGETDIQPRYKEQLAALLKPEIFKKDQKLAYRQLGFVEENEIPFWHIEHAENIIFTGREDILSQLARVPTARHAPGKEGKPQLKYRPQVLTGIAGVGKTQIVVEYARRYKQENHTVILLSADSPAMLTLELSGLAQTLGLSEQDVPDQKRVIAAVQKWFSSPFLTRWLLIFDNVDSPEAMQAVMDFLPRDYYGHVLLTTRMDDPGAEVYSLEQIRVKSMLEEDGATLLLRRAGFIGEKSLVAEAPGGDSKEAAALTNALGGLPLALDQAGAYIRENRKTLHDYATLYKAQRAELLRYRGDYGKAFKYPESVVVTFTLNFKKVGDEAQELLRFLAFLAPDNILEELISSGACFLGPILEPVAGDEVRFDKALKNLLRYSLIDRLTRVDNKIPQVRERFLAVHRLIQAVIQDQMRVEEQRVWIGRVVSTLNLAFSSAVIDIISPKPDESLPLPKARQICARSLPQAQACTELINQKGIFHDFDAMQTLYTNITRYLRDRALFAYAQPFFRQLMAIEEAELGVEHPLFALTLVELAETYRFQEKYQEAEQLLNQAKSVLRDEQGRWNTQYKISSLACLSGLINLYVGKGKYTEAEELFVEVIDFLHNTALADIRQKYLASTFAELGTLFMKEGKPREAELYLKKAIEAAEKFLGHNYPYLADFYVKLAVLYMEDTSNPLTLENSDKARTYLQQALDIAFQDDADEGQIAYILTYLGRLYFEQRNFEDALQIYLQALSLHEAIAGEEHSSEDVINDLYSLGTIYLEQNMISEAIIYFKQAITITKNVVGEQNLSMARNLYELGLCHHRLFLQYSSEEVSSITESEGVERMYLHNWSKSPSKISAQVKRAGKLYIKAYEMLEALEENEHPLAAQILADLKKLHQEWTKHVEKQKGKLE